MAWRRPETTAASVASRFASVTGHSARWAGSTSTGNLSRAKLRSRGGDAEESPNRAAHPRFHRTSCQSAANTAAATSPRRASTRCTPGGRWSETVPSAGGTSRASRYRWPRSAMDSCRARAREATDAEGAVARPCQGARCSRPIPRPDQPVPRGAARPSGARGSPAVRRLTRQPVPPRADHQAKSGYGRRRHDLHPPASRVVRVCARVVLVFLPSKRPWPGPPRRDQHRAHDDYLHHRSQQGSRP